MNMSLKSHLEEDTEDLLERIKSLEEVNDELSEILPELRKEFENICKKFKLEPLESSAYRKSLKY